MTELPTHVDIRDVSLRDGLQIEDPIPLSAKLELLAAVAATGVREMEATAFVSPSKVPALADAADLAAELHNFPGIEFSALVASPNGAKRAIAAGLRSIEYVVSAADGHSRANVGRSSAEATALIPEIVAIAHDSGVTVEVIVATAWDCPFDGPTPPQRVLDIVKAACDNGVDRLAIADTIGTTTPRRVSDLVALVRPRIGDIPLGAHFHNTRGAGLASAYAAVTAGITRLDASVGGLGGCPFAPGASGNIATEDLVYLLRDSGIHVDVDLQAAIDAARVAQTAVRHGLPSSLLRAGDRILDELAVPVETLSAKGRQTREAIELAARKLFAERGFHGTTLGDITSAAGKSPAVFYRYFTDKEDLLAALAQSFLHEVVAPSGLSVDLPDSPDDDDVLPRSGHRLLEHVQTEHRHHDRGRAAGCDTAAFRRRAERVSSLRHKHRRRIGAPRPGTGLWCRTESRTHRRGDRIAVRELHDGVRRNVRPRDRDR